MSDNSRDYFSHVRREVAKSRTIVARVRRMRHESFGDYRRASAAAWVSYRPPSIPCIAHTCPFTEFSGPAGVGANAAHSERAALLVNDLKQNPAVDKFNSLGALEAILRRG